jgi:hypothetical protein
LITFRQRAFMAAALLVCLPTAIWAVHGGVGFSSAEPGDWGGVETAYGETHEYDSVPHGVDVGKLEPLAKYFVPGDHTTNIDAGDGSGRATAHPHGKQTCASGCASDQHPTPPLLKEEFQRLMALYAHEPMSDQSEGLETLLYYGRQSLLYLDQLGPGPLDKQREEFLRRELYVSPTKIDRLHVLVELRVVDEFGVVRVWNKPAPVPLDKRFGFEFTTNDYQRIEESTGTVKRVGLYHLWQRI